MIRLPGRIVLSVLAALTAIGTLAGQQPGASDPLSPDVRWSRAAASWQRGDYPSALDDLIALANSPAGDPYLGRAASLTGERFVTSELTPDGRNARLSPDAAFASYETGPAAIPTTVVWRTNTAEPVRIAELAGSFAAFHPAEPLVAWIRLPQDGAWDAAVAAARGLTGPEGAAAARRLGWLLASRSDVVVRDLRTGSDTVVASPGLLKRELAWTGAAEIAFVGAPVNDPDQVQIYAAPLDGGPARVLTDTPGFKQNLTADPEGRTILFQVGAAAPFVDPDAETGQARRGPGETPGVGSWGVLDRETERVRFIDSRDVAMSGDGRRLAWTERDGDTYRLLLAPAAGSEVTTVREDDLPLQMPALSPNGSRLAYARRDGADWNVYVWSQAGGHVRITDDIQHDLLPQFLTETTLVTVRGEPRHRRSTLHDLEGGTSVRLFSNNTIRTISPEYTWTPSRDGRALAIQADRDGDTISPARGVSVVHLDRLVSQDALVARWRRQQADESALRARGTEAFAPIAGDVRRVTEGIEADRVRQHIEALTGFGSRYVTQPGNRLAIDYLAEAFRAAGYEPDLQWFRPARAEGADTANVVATLRGTASPDIVYLLTSHFDSVAGGPGADDNASGTAALLEVARRLAASPLPATVMFGALTGEEAGLLGAQELTRRLVAAGVDVRGVLNNDMIGWGADRPEPDNTIRYANAAIRDIQHGAALSFTSLITYDARYYRGTDAGVFYEAFGEIVGGFGSHPVLGNPHYHQPSDTPDTVSIPQIVETARATAATLMLLASSPSPVRDLTATRTADGVDVTWSPSPEPSVRAYRVTVEPGAGRTGSRPPLVTATTDVRLAGLSSGDVVRVRSLAEENLTSWDGSAVVVP